MRKALTFLGASLCLGLVAPVNAQVAPDMFRDVPQEHWAYQAVEALRAKGILIGYPDGFFRGKRTLTRYEFAVALQRALENVQLTPGPPGPPGAPGAQGAQGEVGPAGPQGPPGITPEELENFRRLAQEFRQELTTLGTNLNALSAKLDRVAADLASVKDQLSRMPKITGQAFLGVRVDRARNQYIDADGRFLARDYTSVTPANASAGRSLYNISNLVDEAVVLHSFQLGVAAKLGGDTTLAAKLNTGNYVSYLGGSVGYDTHYLKATPDTDTYLDQLEINVPFSAAGVGGGLTLGRYHYNISPLTLWKPDVDTYFDNPIFDDGMYRMDGVKVGTGFGSVGLQVFGGSMKTVSGISNSMYNNPLAGATSPAVLRNGAKPFGQNVDGALFLGQMAGVNLNIPIGVMHGAIRATALHATGLHGDSSTSPLTGNQYTNTSVVGAGADLKFSDRINFTGEWAKSVTGRGRDIGSDIHGDDNAFTGSVGYNGGPLTLSAGYKYIDPLFYAPGYWGRIGNWINPTNVQGPTVRAGYNLTPAIALNVGGDFFTGTRNRGPEGLTTSDDIQRVLVGLRWGLSKSFTATVDWEGVYWSVEGSAAPGTSGRASSRVHPTEQYVTIGTGYHVSDTTVLKLGYQIGTYSGRGENGGVGTLGTSYNFNAFTSQVAVKF